MHLEPISGKNFTVPSKYVKDALAQTEQYNELKGYFSAINACCRSGPASQIHPFATPTPRYSFCPLHFPMSAVIPHRIKVKVLCLETGGRGKITDEYFQSNTFEQI